VTKSLFSVLVVEDEPQIRLLLRSTLFAAGYRVIETGSGKRALIEAASHKPDLVLLDLGLPDLDGVEVVKGIRAWSTMPIVIVSARAQETQKVAALDAGADDYLTKPFGVNELLARVRVALRHAAQPRETTDQVLEFGAVTVDLEARRATGPDGTLHLTPTEYKLLTVLAKHADMVVTHSHLLREVWGPAHQERPHYLRVYMKQLREKLEPIPARPKYLLTETGIGYRLLQEKRNESPVTH
jgi:two-component system, OmpR family, KDP operon response regulator KdpE